MPYQSSSALPEAVRKYLPKHAQDMYREAYNGAYGQYKDPDKRRNGSREQTAHQVAWNAVKSKYEKGEDGHWHRKQS
ncbi:MAG: ChaB family protein [Candidatus Binatia bacterium]